MQNKKNLTRLDRLQPNLDILTPGKNWNSHQFLFFRGVWRVLEVLSTARAFLLCVVEYWSIKAAQGRVLEVFDHRCLLTILRFRISDQTSNDDIHRHYFNVDKILSVIRLYWLGNVLRRTNERLNQQILFIEFFSTWRKRKGEQWKNRRSLVRQDLEPVGGFRALGHKWDKL